MNNILNKIKHWDFEVRDKTDNSLLAIIHYHRTLDNEKAEIDFKINPDTEMHKLGPWFVFAFNRVPDQSFFLVDFLHDRVNPINRLGLIECCESIGVDPYDWIARMRLNEGRAAGDNLKVLVVDLDE